MPSPENYTHFFDFSTLPDSTTIYTSQVRSSYAVFDDRDSSNDDMTAIGDDAGWLNTSSFSSGSMTLVGFDGNGDPIFAFNSVYRLFTNTTGQSGNINFTNTGVYAYCFGEGTMIATPTGETAVEALSIGDLVRAQDGNVVPVKWIGRQTIAKRYVGANGKMVRIAAGTLGNHSDLYVTGDHGMIVDGIVINASALVNGGSINWVPLPETPDRFIVYHIETEAHDVIFANGAASETFLDAAGRAMFDNHAEYLDLYGVERIIPEMRAPRINAQRMLPDAIRARLAIEAEVVAFSAAG